MADERTRLVVGCMTGTSLDGLDVALVKITGTGLAMKAELIGHHALPMPDDLRETLLSLASGEPNEPIVCLRAARALGELHADGIEQLIISCPLSLEGEGRGEGGAQNKLETNNKNTKPKIDFITAHGQTVWHAPRDEAGPKSWQLFDPWPIVRRLKLPVCYDLRQADLIAGGEGAPLTPIADWVIYRGKVDLVINFGGVMNYSFTPNIKSRVNGGDLIPCNILLDGLCQRLFSKVFDRDGLLAAQGRLDEVVSILLREKIDQAKQQQSLGREQFSTAWLDDLVAGLSVDADPHDVLFTTCEFVASVTHSLIFPPWTDKPQRAVLAGGGSKNKTLVELIRTAISDNPFAAVDKKVVVSDSLGIPCEAREAMAFAVLGALSQDGVPVSLPQVTGATDPGVAGVWAGL